MNKIVFLIGVLFIFGTPQADYNTDILAWLNGFNTPKFSEISNVKTLKKTFFNHLSPIIAKENNKIAQLRKLIKQNKLSTEMIQSLVKKYRLKNSTQANFLHAIDIIPRSLVLAQAAIESNWGRSRFAKLGHNYFGIWCYEKGCGITPKKRNSHAKHEVKKFPSLERALSYYFLTLNRGSAYVSFRAIRAKARTKNKQALGSELSLGLKNYSGIGHQYTQLIQNIIRQNKLELTGL
jgi:Bax protein